MSVVGAGIYGCLASIELSRAGFAVDLYDRSPGILNGATSNNQGRLHLGYHYPRSPETQAATKHSATLFGERYASCVSHSGLHHYAIADDSKVSWQRYLDSCRSAGLAVNFLPSSPFRIRNTQGCLYSSEAFLDRQALRLQILGELSESNVNVHLRRSVAIEELQDFGPIVNATYGRLSPQPFSLQYEVTEVAIVRLSRTLYGHGIVIMDGPFVSVDPMIGSSLHYLYDVGHSVHWTGVGSIPPPHLADLVDVGATTTPFTHFEAMTRTAARYLPGLSSARYVASLFTMRAVLVAAEATDSRPSCVSVDPGSRTVTVLSGKLGDSISTAHDVVAAVRSLSA